jgi:hypothetical protein
VTKALVPWSTATSQRASSSNSRQVKEASLPKFSSCAAPALARQCSELAPMVGSRNTSL